MAGLFSRYPKICVLCLVLFCHQISLQASAEDEDKQSTGDGTQSDIILHRLDGGEIGDVREIVLDSVKLQMKTVSLKPLLFEIPNFLSAEECSHYIDLANQEGLEESMTVDNLSKKRRFTLMDKDMDRKMTVTEMRHTIEAAMDVYLDEADIMTMYEETKLDTDHDGMIDEEEIQNLRPLDLKLYIKKLLETSPEKHSRYSQQIWLYPDNSTDPLFESLQERVSKVVQLPPELIKRSDFQVVKYVEKGHYNAHWDSAIVNKNIPCCTGERTADCRICRFMTVLVYLNDVEEGGETAFPVAGNETIDKEALQYQQLNNLFKSCDQAKLKIKPELGKAVIWYNHFVDPESGWLGELDDFSVHGGCNVGKGEKWIGNFWIKATDNKQDDVNQMFNTYQRDEL